MKYTIITILTLLFCISASAQKAENVKLKEIHIKKSGDNVQLHFKAEISSKAVKSNYKLTLTPILYKENDSIRLKPIVVYTRKSKIIRKREQISAGKYAINNTDEYRAQNKEVVDYSYVLPYQEWMNGASVTITQTVAGCCTEKNEPSIILAENLALIPIIPEPVIPEVKPQQYKWTFSKEDMIIDFIVSKTEINFDLFENQEILAEIVKAVKKIQATRGASLDKIEITGYASPEGKRDLNFKLGENRAIALRDYLKEQVPSLKDEDFNLINGEENWKGLRNMVAASDMKDKEAILHIIDNVPVEVDLVKNTSRKKQLMDFKKGDPYRFMLKNFYPRLRNACYIGVYYINKEHIN